jgi:mannose-6-phosphate isomerase-like protein (cupin superfamily)
MRLIIYALALSITTAAPAQSGPAGTAAPGIDRRSSAAIDAQAATLLAQANNSPGGVASVTLEKYPGHFTMLAVRTKSGGAEMHANWNDIFVVLDGEATEMTGGAIVDARPISAAGETGGARLEGGIATPMRKGDVIHIDPNTPHQTILAPGKTFTYYVIKVAAFKD